MKKIIAIIPSRYGSSRFPGKPLAKILDKPMVQWVYERVTKINEIEKAYVATDDQRIYDAVLDFGGNAIMTSDKHESGSDRVNEAIASLDDIPDIVLNIQGDEPMIRADMIESLIRAFDDESVCMATLKKKILLKEEIENPNIAKVITNNVDDAVYFSRSIIPYDRDGLTNTSYFKHIGIYAYTTDFLRIFSSLGTSFLERTEQLEQLRAIENGYKIRVVETEHQSIGVDLPNHIKIIEKELLNEKKIYENKN